MLDLRVIPGFTKYAVCHGGFVWRVAPYENAAWRNRPVPRKLNPGVTSKGYLQVSIPDDQGVLQSQFVHTLVLKGFRTRRRLGQDQCNHKDGCKTNNSPGNLEWATSQENIRHSYKLGLIDLQERSIRVKKQMATPEARARNSLLMKQLLGRPGQIEKSIGELNKINERRRHARS